MCRGNDGSFNKVIEAEKVHNIVAEKGYTRLLPRTRCKRQSPKVRCTRQSPKQRYIRRLKIKRYATQSRKTRCTRQSPKQAVLRRRKCWWGPSSLRFAGLYTARQFRYTLLSEKVECQPAWPKIRYAGGMIMCDAGTNEKVQVCLGQSDGRTELQRRRVDCIVFRSFWRKGVHCSTFAWGGGWTLYGVG